MRNEAAQALIEGHGEDRIMLGTLDQLANHVLKLTDHIDELKLALGFYAANNRWQGAVTVLIGGPIVEIVHRYPDPDTGEMTSYVEKKRTYTQQVTDQGQIAQAALDGQPLPEWLEEAVKGRPVT